MAQTTSQSSVLRTTKLTSTVATSSSVLIDRFSDILEIASANNKDKYITAAETYQIDVHAAAMVRAAEELLNVTRKLKQLWILSEARDDSLAQSSGVDERLKVGDVAKELRRIIRKEEVEGAMEDVQETKEATDEVPKVE